MTVDPHKCLLVVDDDTRIVEMVAHRLARKPYEVITATSGTAALDILGQRQVQVVLLDLNMPKLSGLEVLMHIRTQGEAIEAIFLTGSESVETAVEAMRLGAFHYLTKPVDMKELAIVIDQAFAKQGLAHENELLRRAIDHQDGGGDEVVAASEAMRQVLADARHVAPTDLPVLITGETGVGKEVVARIVHEASGRRGKARTVINCGAIPDNLIDAELFGHAKGAFTGADANRPGLVEVADGGTLILDEIGDLPVEVQARLLRVLENGVLRRVGDAREIPVDLRVVAATNQPLERMRAAGTFREDLYHRLAGYTIHVPPLRERREDIVPLARFFLARGHGAPVPLSAAAERELERRPWPGNARQLRNAVEGAWLEARRAGATIIEVAHLPTAATAAMETAPPATVDPATMPTLKEQEARYIQEVLAACGGSRVRAAQVLGITERTLYRKLAP